MAVQTSCPACRQPLRLPNYVPGQQIKCPTCQSTFVPFASVQQPANSLTLTTPAASPPPYQTVSPAAGDKFTEKNPNDLQPIIRPPPAKTADFEDEFVFRPRPKIAPHRSTLVFVLGIVSVGLLVFFGLGFATGIPAWIIGTADVKKMRAGVMDRSGLAMTNVGRHVGLGVGILNLVVCIGVICVHIIWSLDD
jgi:hypothetical protein